MSNETEKLPPGIYETTIDTIYSPLIDGMPARLRLRLTDSSGRTVTLMEQWPTIPTEEETEL